MLDVLYYNTTTGEIVGQANFEDDALVADITADLDTGETYMYGIADEEQQYITFPGGVPTITDRPTILADPEQYLVADNTIVLDITLPTGTTVTYNNTETISVAGEHLQIQSNGLEGDYEFLVDPPFPYIPVTPLRIHFNAV